MGVIVGHLSFEQKIREIFAQQEDEKGIRVLLKVIAEAARQRKFVAAHKLRELLIELAPAALNEIIRAAEIIDSEKTAAIDEGFLEVWRTLAGSLEWEEFVAVYHALEHRKYPKDQMVVKQGDKTRSLYFIDSGRVELFFSKDSSDILIKTMVRGQILGGGSFFGASVWTYNVRSLGANISVLRWDAIHALRDEFPGLESKLNDFCAAFNIKADAIAKTGSDRRTYERIRVGGRIAMAVLDRDGNATRTGAVGELFDISAGGASFYLRFSKKETADLLLTRKVSLSLNSAGRSEAGLVGKIVAVRSQPVVGNEYAVSLQFDKILSPRELTILLDKIRGNGHN